MTKFVVFVSAAVLTACAPAHPVPTAVEVGPAGTEVQLRRGQSVRLGDSAVVTFRTVQSDSRCPRDVQCIQAGNAAVVFDVKTGRAAAEVVVLNTGQIPREVPLMKKVLRLSGLAPVPAAGVAADSSAYVATICWCEP